MGEFKLQPVVINKVEFKNGVGQIILTVAKLDNDKMIFVPKYGNCVLNDKEQGKLLDFLLENL